jgi:hypothetical protein
LGHEPENSPSHLGHCFNVAHCEHLLEQTQHTLAQPRRISQSFHSDGPLADARKIEEVRFRAWRNKQMMELEIKCEPCGRFPEASRPRKWVQPTGQLN